MLVNKYGYEDESDAEAIARITRAVTVIQRSLGRCLQERHRQEASKTHSEEQTPHSRDQHDAESYYSVEPKEVIQVPHPKA